MQIDSGPILRLIGEMLDKNPMLREEVITSTMRATGKERWEIEKLIADARDPESEDQ